MSTLAGLLLLGGLAELAAHAQVSDVEVRGAIERFYFATQPAICATLKVDWIHKDFERKGFFRIGILPLVAVEGVSFEVSSPESAANSFAQMQTWLAAHVHGANRLELRRVRLVIETSGTNVLECGRIRLAQSGEWELLDEVSVRAGTNQLQTTRATLRMAGAEAGRLILGNRPGLPLNFFSTSLNDQITQGKKPE